MSDRFYRQQHIPTDEEDYFDYENAPQAQQPTPFSGPYQQHFPPSNPPSALYNQAHGFPQQSGTWPQHHAVEQPLFHHSYDQQAHYNQHQPQPLALYDPMAGYAIATPTVPSNYPHEQYPNTTFPPYAETADFTPSMPAAGPSTFAPGHLSPDQPSDGRQSRSISRASNASSISRPYSHSDASTRSVSPSLGEMQRCGRPNHDGTWSCNFPGCTSKSRFNRGCDLRKHYKRRTKSLFCRVEGCPQATEGGFSSKKDRARHEAKHNPNILCEWEGCDRLFSRVDNMKDHVRRVHRRERRP